MLQHMRRSANLSIKPVVLEYVVTMPANVAPLRERCHGLGMLIIEEGGNTVSHH